MSSTQPAGEGVIVADLPRSSTARSRTSAQGGSSLSLAAEPFPDGTDIEALRDLSDPALANPTFFESL